MGYTKISHKAMTFDCQETNFAVKLPYLPLNKRQIDELVINWWNVK